MRVLSFSLGFGPRIAGFRRGGTEYVISALPLGGYVRMLGENPRDEVRAADAERLGRAPVDLRAAVVIAVAGPLMNLAFPILLYFVVFLGDNRLTPATVGLVLPNRPAAGKLAPGDRVVEIDGSSVETFYDLTRVVERSAGKPLRFVLERDGKRIERTVTPAADIAELPLDLHEAGRPHRHHAQSSARRDRRRRRELAGRCCRSADLRRGGGRGGTTDRGAFSISNACCNTTAARWCR